METIETKCRECGCSISVDVPDNLGDFREMFIKGITGGIVCDQCDGIEQERQRDAERRYMAEHALAGSGIPVELTEWNDSKASDEMREFARTIFRAGVQQRKSLIVSGNNRTGKTRAVCRSAATMIQRGNLGMGDVRYFTARDLRRKITRLAQGDSEFEESNFYYSLAKTSLLIIDDVDKGNWTPASLEGFFRIIDDRVIRPAVRLWVTTNCSDSELTASLIGRDEGKRELAIGIVARIREMCVPIKFEGRSAR